MFRARPFGGILPTFCGSLETRGIMQIVVGGSIAYDYLMRFPGRFRDHLIDNALDRVSLSFWSKTCRRERGGSGANIAFNLALLGERPLLMSTAGLDFPEYKICWISMGWIPPPCGSSRRSIPRRFFCNTDTDNNQIGSFYTGAMAFTKGYKLNGGSRATARSRHQRAE